MLRRLRPTVLIPCLCALALLAACSSGGGPTSPSLDAPASIAGEVVDSTSAAGSRGAVSGVTVRVEGTDIAATTNAQGQFSLVQVPMGDQLLSFESAGQRAELPIADIQPAESIGLVVALLGSTVQVQSMDRGDGTGSKGMTLEKATNGEDADRAPGPSIPVGDPVAWEYVVTNTGDVRLGDVAVTDDQGVVVSCPATSLEPGASMTCTGDGVATAGQYANLGTASALDPTGAPLEASDPSHYFGTEVTASVDLEKSTNGEDADRPPGPTIPVGAPILWEYDVTNDGGVDLLNVVVSDDQGVAVQCPQTSLLVGESMTCTGAGVAIAGQYANLGSVSADDGAGVVVDDDDLSHYFGADDTGGSFTADIQSDRWNTNWPNSSGLVSAKIQGGDLTTIDPTTILLYEGDPLTAAEPTTLPGITGNHMRAKFSKAEAFAILDNPESGETRTVTLAFIASGVPVELQVPIEIVGPPI